MDGDELFSGEIVRLILVSEKLQVLRGVHLINAFLNIETLVTFVFG